MRNRASVCGFAVAALGLSTACNSEGTLCAGSLVYEEPLIRIAAVSDPASGSVVSPVTFSQFRLGTSDYSPKFFLTPPGLINAAVIDGQVICNVVCAFGNLEGTFSFTVQSPGYAAKQITVDAKYSTVTGKCEKRASGPTEVRITLEKL